MTDWYGPSETLWIVHDFRDPGDDGRERFDSSESFWKPREMIENFKWIQWKWNVANKKKID